MPAPSSPKESRHEQAHPHCHPVLGRRPGVYLAGLLAHVVRGGLGSGRSRSDDGDHAIRLCNGVPLERAGAPPMSRLRTFINLTRMRLNSIGLVRSARWAAGLAFRK